LLDYLTAAFAAGELQFFSDFAHLNEPRAFAAIVARLNTTKWVVYAKKPLAGPKQVLAYLARYAHRVAITNNRLLALDETHVSFRCTDYREAGGYKNKVMRMEIAEFIRRFLLHVLPDGFHRIRYYGFLANGQRADKLALCRNLLGVLPTAAAADRNNNRSNRSGSSKLELPPCPCCGGRMQITETFDGPLSRPYRVRRLDAL